MTIYNDPHILVTMMVMEMYVSVMFVRHSIGGWRHQTKCRRHNDLAIAVNDASPW